MTGLFAFLVPFLAGLFFVIPGLFDTTMMSRLAIYPLLAAVVLFQGRRSIGKTHLFTGITLALLPAISLIWSSSPLGGVPFAVRWFSFGMMITGFSGTVNRYGIEPLLRGLSAAAAVTAALMILAGPDTITGNPNRTGMVLSLGFTASIHVFRRRSWYSWILPPLILSGVAVSAFLTGWIACFLGGTAVLLGKRRVFDRRHIIPIMIAGQIALSVMPDLAGRIGPTLELRSRIWRCSSSLFQENLPLGTGTGSARLVLFTSAEPELRRLAGENRRVDYLHSEPLELITESGIPGLLLVIFLLIWFLRKAHKPLPNALLLAFWPVFATDLPLATPLGALPAALFFAAVPGFSRKRLDLHPLIPGILILISLFWGYIVITGYGAMGGGGSPSAGKLELACERIPWEERAFLAAGHAHLAQGSVLAAIEDANTFIDLYPSYYMGWELKAMALSAAGRDCSSEWARAALLSPGGTSSNDLLLMVINGIDSRGMDPDTARMLGEAFCDPNRGDLGSLVDAFSNDQLLGVSGKLLVLTDYCRNNSPRLAAELWFTALTFAAVSEEEIPAATVLAIFDGIDLYTEIPADWTQKADRYLDVIMDQTGTGPGALSP